MSKSISIQDTHRLPYSNAVVTAVKMENGNTTPLHMFDSEGNDLGEELYTNAKGYLCDSNGTLYTNGVFVEEEAEIKLTLRDGAYTTWRVKPDSDTEVNDGVLYGKTPESPENAPVLIPVFSANSENPGYLRWGNILDKPGFNQWSENEEVVKLESATDEITLGRFTKTVTVMLDSDFDGGGADHYELTVKQHASRYAQVVAIRNNTARQLVLKDAVGRFVTRVNPLNSGEVSNTAVIEAHKDGLFNPTVDTSLVCDAPDGVTLDTVTSLRNGITIDDATPDLLRVVIPDSLKTSVSSMTELSTVLTVPVTVDCTRRRKVRLFIQNQCGGGMRLTSSGQFIGSVRNLECIELMCYGASERQVGQVHCIVIGDQLKGFPKESMQFNADTALVRVPLYVDNVAITLTNELVTAASVWMDGFSEGLTILNIDNQTTHDAVFTVKLAIDGSGVAYSNLGLTAKPGLSMFVIRRAGLYVSLVASGGNGGNDRNHVTPVLATDRGGSATGWFDVPDYTENSYIDVDFAWLAKQLGLTEDRLGNWGTDYDDIVLAVKLDEGMHRQLKVELKNYFTISGNNSIRLSIADIDEFANNASNKFYANSVTLIDGTNTRFNVVRSRTVLVDVVKNAGVITATWTDWSEPGV